MDGVCRLPVTPLVRILATLLRFDAGRAKVAGFDVARDDAQVRYSIRLAGQQAAVDDILTGRQNLIMFGRLYRLDGRASRSIWLDQGRRTTGKALLGRHVVKETHRAAYTARHTGGHQ
jgi:hypothetical protein